MRAVLDASAVLAYLRGEPGSPVAREAIRRGCAVSAINWAEVLSKLAERGRDPEVATRDLVDAGILGEGLTIYPLDEAQAVEIAKLRPTTRGAGLSLADRACLALAASLDLPALTADRAWSGVGLGLQIELIR